MAFSLQNCYWASFPPHNKDFNRYKKLGALVKD